jgi:DNA-binding XRE family transcriptional regulator
MTSPYNTNLAAGGLKTRRAPWVQEPAQSAPATKLAAATAGRAGSSSIEVPSADPVELLTREDVTDESDNGTGSEATRQRRFRLRHARPRRIIFLSNHAWMTTGAQIRAARALLGWTRQDLAAAAGLHPNAVAYWERHRVIPSPPDCELPFACHRMTSALKRAGVVMVPDPGPGVALKPDVTGQMFEALYGQKGSARAAFEDLLRRTKTDTSSKEQSPPS